MNFIRHNKKGLFCFLWLFFFTTLFAQEYIGLSNPPGSYNEDLTLLLTKKEPDINIFYQFLDNNGIYGPWIPFVDSIELTAAGG